MSFDEEIERREKRWERIDRELAEEGIKKMQSGYYGKGKNSPLEEGLDSEDIERMDRIFTQGTGNPIAKASTCIGVKEFFICLPKEAIENLKCGDIEEKKGKAHICAVPPSENPSLIHMDKKPIEEQ